MSCGLRFKRSDLHFVLQRHMSPCLAQPVRHYPRQLPASAVRLRSCSWSQAICVPLAPGLYWFIGHSMVLASLIVTGVEQCSFCAVSGMASCFSTMTLRTHGFATDSLSLGVSVYPSGPDPAALGCLGRSRTRLCAAAGPWGLTEGSRCIRRLCVVSVLVMLNCELLVCPRGYRRNDFATVS